MLQSIDDISVKAAEVLDGPLGTLGELSADFLLDSAMNLWLVELNGKPQKCIYSDIKTSGMKPSFTAARCTMLFPCAAVTLAGSSRPSKETYCRVKLGDKVKTFALPGAENYRPISWSPSDKLLLNHNGQACLATSGAARLYICNCLPMWEVLSWLDGDNFMGTASLVHLDTGYEVLVRVNIETGEVKDLGLAVNGSFTRFEAWGKFLAVTNIGEEVCLYEIPWE